jgi:hypothetical protein
LQQGVPLAVVERLGTVGLREQDPHRLATDVGTPQHRQRVLLIAGGRPCHGFSRLGLRAGRRPDEAVEQRLTLVDLLQGAFDALELGAQALAGVQQLTTMAGELLALGLGGFEQPGRWGGRRRDHRCDEGGFYRSRAGWPVDKSLIYEHS